MSILSGLNSLYRKLGWLEKITLLLLATYIGLRFMAPAGSLIALMEIGLTVAVFAVFIRLARSGMKKALWELRYRLLVTYLFIAVVPSVLILGLVGANVYVLSGQVAVYLVRAELDHRAQTLAGAMHGLLATTPELRAERIRWTGTYFREHLPGLELLVRSGKEWRYPEQAPISLPPRGWKNARGVVVKDNRAYLWAYAVTTSGDALAMAPLTRQWLGGLVPDLGEVIFLKPDELPPFSREAAPRQTRPTQPEERPAQAPPPPRHLDSITWSTLVPVALWESPGTTKRAGIGGTTRFSAVVGTLFSQRLNMVQELWLPLCILVAALVLVAEAVSLVIGVSMTRTITRAVHNLYEGTQRVMEGNFSHRIEVRGRDQLAELGVSFNRMTENLERLVRIEKEKERLQSELEIAREVQNQLYPKSVPPSRHLELTALCHPARVVSGDYYDYMALDDSRIAAAIGDVVGKGISAALLMSTVQASLRAQIRASLGAGGPAECRHHNSVSTGGLVSQLNQQLYAYTSPEKFATFFFAIYDERDSVLTYTNAGHPPPILIRGGKALRLDVNGIIVGAFPFAEYQESRIELMSGDLLVCFTDGITEPENEYGEPFGEQNLVSTLLKETGREPDQVIASVISSVEQWTHSPEQEDDMTLLLIRRL
jgi:phosphoserine phosphatase RsbU/P